MGFKVLLTNYLTLNPFKIIFSIGYLFGESHITNSIDHLVYYVLCNFSR